MAKTLNQNSIPSLEQMGVLKMKEAVADESLEAEVLAQFIGDRRYFDSVCDSLSPESFNNMHHRAIYDAIKSICDEGFTPDLQTVWQKVQSLDEMITMPTFAQILTKGCVSDLKYSVAVLDHYRKRRAMYYYGLKLVGDSTNMSIEIDEEINKVSLGLVDVLDVSAHEIVGGGDVQDQLMDRIQQRMHNPNIDMGVMTGFKFVDNGFGIHTGDFIVIAGETGAGKTSLTLNVVNGAIMNGAKVALYSLEMSRIQVQAKLLSRNSGIRQGRLLYSQLTQQEYVKLCQVHSQTYAIYNERLFYNDKFTSNIERIIADIRSKKKRLNISIAVIDYMQIATSGVNSRSKSGNKEQELANMSRMLRNLANDLQIAIIVLSQLNRDSENPVPSRDRLRGSGQIAEAATDIWLLYRPAQDENSTLQYPPPFEQMDIKGSAMVIVDKSRFGKPSKYLIGFEGKTTTFYEFDKEIEESPF